MKIKLTKLQLNHSNLRTNEVIGESPALPEVGSDFYLFGEALSKEDGKYRFVRTTPITEITHISPEIIEFKTANSAYRIDLMKDEEK